MISRKKRTEIVMFGALVILLLVISLLTWVAVKNRKPGVTVAVASRELALVLVDRSEIEAAEESLFAAEDRENWYAPYMDYLYEADLLNRQITKASPRSASGELTMEMLKVMADGLGLWQGSSVWQEKRVTAELWTAFLTEVMDRYSRGQVKQTEVSVYATAAVSSELEPWHVATDRGEYSFAGFSMDNYLDCRVEVWLRGQEIIRVSQRLGADVTYTNMLVEAAEGKSLTLFFAGYSRRFSLEESAGLYPKQIIDLKLTDGQMTTLRRKSDRLDSRIIALGETGAELENYGVLPFASDMRVYQTYGKITQRSVHDVIIGYDIYDVVVAEGEICAVLIRQSPDAKTIRVLLTEGSGAVKHHNGAVVTSASDFSVTAGSLEVVVSAGEMVIIDELGIRRADGFSDSPLLAELSDGQRVTVKADCGQIKINSLTRTFGNPVYPGTLELLYLDGGFYLINETLIEDYLCYVVPTEMPADYHKEALKAQAICARGYAVNQLASTRYRELGAHVDDTVNYQVYNYAAAEERTTAAVKETYGKVLTYDEEIVTTFYFSTSCGFTTDAAVWGEDTAKLPYLTAKRVSGIPVEGEITDEAVFRAFIMNGDLKDYETAYGWYRWTTAVTLEELTVTVNQRLANISSSLKNRVLTRQSDGTWKPGGQRVGQVENISVLKRGAGGIASEVEIVGSEATVRLLLQSAIREVLGSSAYEYQRMNGSVITGWANLPSAYFCPEPVYTDGVLTGYVFYGGGSGHGVGMSQNGANAMGESGVDAETILKFFYEGTAVTQLYE